MVKKSQALPPAPGGSPGGGGTTPPPLDPLAGLGGMGGPGGIPPALNAAPGGAPATPPTTPPTPPGGAGAPQQEGAFKGLTSPEDVMNDFNIQEALTEQFDTEQLANQIWKLYGGDSVGIDSLPGKIGTWPEFPDESVKQDEIDKRHKDTQDPESRYKRLAKGYTIKDIFNNEGEIKRLITYTVETMQKKPKSFTRASWYKFARTN